MESDATSYAQVSATLYIFWSVGTYIPCIHSSAWYQGLILFFGGGGAVEGQQGELQWVDPSAFAEHIKLTTTIPLIS